MIFSNYCSDSKKKIHKNTHRTHSCDDERIVAPSSDSSSSHSHSSDEKLICPKCCAGSSYSEYLRQIKKQDREKKDSKKKFCESKKRKHERISDEEDDCKCDHDRSRSGSDTSITLTKYERVKRRLGLKGDQKYENRERRLGLDGNEKNLRHQRYKRKDSGIQCGYEKRIHNSLSPESDNDEIRSEEKSKHHGKRFKSASDAKRGRYSEHRRHNHHHHRSQRYKSVSSSS